MDFCCPGMPNFYSKWHPEQTQWEFFFLACKSIRCQVNSALLYAACCSFSLRIICLQLWQRPYTVHSKPQNVMLRLHQLLFQFFYPLLDYSSPPLVLFPFTNKRMAHTSLLQIPSHTSHLSSPFNLSVRLFFFNMSKDSSLIGKTTSTLKDPLR